MANSNFRVHYNFNIIKAGKISEDDVNPKSGWKNYGKIKTEYILVNGSVQIFDRATKEKTNVDTDKIYEKIMELL